MEKLYTLQETANLLKVSTRTVLRYIKSGKLEAIKIGQWRVSKTAIQNFLDNSKNLTNINNAKHNKR